MLTMKDIVRDDQASLREKSKPVELPPSKETKNTLNRMLEFLINSQDDEIAEK